MFHTSCIEINEAAFRQNIAYLKQKTGPDTRFSSVIKGNAYGHGIETILPIAEASGVDHFSVFSADEALRASEVRSPGSDIMIMGMIDDYELEWAIESGISFYVFEIERLEAAVRAAKKTGQKARIHIELETGMYRTGFNKNELEIALPFLKENMDSLVIEGICTHLAGAESISNYLRVKNQIKAYSKLNRMIDKTGLAYKKKHIACSAAAIRYPKTILDMVRIGIAQYGLWPNRETFMQDVVENNRNELSEDPLKRVISWKSKVMSTKRVPANRFIGYGTSYLTNDVTYIATVPVGYTHGFNRSLSNLGRVLINGNRLPVIGLVNMNMMMVDITGQEEVIKRGDDVIIIGTEGNIDMTVGSFSELTNKLNYETLARLPHDIPRYVV